MSEPAGPGGIWTGYVKEGTHPLWGYALLVSIFSSLFAGFMAIIRITDRSLPERISPGDIALLGIGTYRLSRLLTKDSVTSIFRAPFTEFEQPIGDGEVDERPRGKGLRHAIGELVVCPYCVGQWVSAFFTYGFVLAPRFTRLVASMFAMYTLADSMQLGMDALKRTVIRMPRGK